MRLKSINYAEYAGLPNEWSLSSFEFSDINLLVGKNSSGKTRSLNVISSLAKLLSGRIQILSSGNFDVQFEDNGEILFYSLEIESSNVKSERFLKQGTVYLDRTVGGKGMILSQKENKLIEFQAPSNQLAAFGRRDQINHPFFEPLYTWGFSLYHFAFSNTFGKNSIALKTDKPPLFDLAADTNQVIRAYKEGENQFGERFKKKVLNDFNSIGYELEDISLSAPVSIQMTGQAFPGQPICLWIKEKSISGAIEQFYLSDGMFRALSLVIQITYSTMVQHPSCILVDDVGEGLDFDRSNKLVDYLLESVKGTNIQLVMASNERLVMNKVPLNAWSIIERRGSKCQIFNSLNSKSEFDDFRFTGLSNFDFLKSDFLHSHKING